MSTRVYQFVDFIAAKGFKRGYEQALEDRYLCKEDAPIETSEIDMDDTGMFTVIIKGEY